MIRYLLAFATVAFAAVSFASPDPIKDTRQIMAGTVTTQSVKNAYLSGARDGTTAFQGALKAYKAVRAAEQPVPTPSPTPSPAGVYDVSIGLGVDANGFANLPLMAGAHRYFVNSTAGSDANGCVAAQVPATPLATPAAGMACVIDGAADQMMIAEGTSYPVKVPSMAFRKGGYSLQYPFVIQSYDPADPLNEAKHGRAGGGKRPVFRGAVEGGNPWIFGGTGQKFIAVRGLDLNPGNLPNMGFGMLDVGDGILIENNIFRYMGVAFVNTSGTKIHHWIVRGNAIFGTWSTEAATGSQGIYADGSDSLTIEDNVLYHIGWKIGAQRTDPILAGGATQFRHPIYQQVPTDAIVRRNLSVDGSADGGTFRGSILHYENLVIDSPIGAGLGGGVDYATGRPTGVDIHSHHNAVLGTATIPDSGANGWGFSTANGRPGSSAHHNLFARSQTQGASAFLTTATYDKPSYMDWHDNVVYQWTQSGYSYFSGAPYPLQVHATFSNNIWDNPTEGSNRNVNEVAFPKPYTAAELYAELGFAGKEAFMAYAIEHPEARIQRRARALLFTGYGMVP